MDSLVVTFTLDDIPSLCRICLNKGSVINVISTICDNVKLQTIFENVINEKVEENDGRPRHLCHKCLTLLIQANNLHKTYKKSKILLDKVLCVNESSTKADPDIIYHDHTYEKASSELKDPLDISDDIVIQNEIAIDDEEFGETQKQIVVSAKAPALNTCKICEYTTPTYNTLCAHYNDEHLIIVKSNRNECKKCKQVFRNRNELFEHYYTDKHQNRHCTSCNEEFSNLKEHFLHKCRQTYTCKLCEIHLNSFEQVVSHFKKEKHEKRKMCMLCGKIIVDKASVHLMQHRPKWIKHTCGICCIIFEDEDELKDHMAQVDHSKKKCNICNFLVMRSKFSQHMSKKHEKKKKRFYCDQCSASYVSPQNLLEHIKSKHDENDETSQPSTKINKPKLDQTVLCEICGKSIKKNNKRHIKLHKTSHKLGQRFLCLAPNCDETFVNRSSRYNHMIENHEKFSCDQCNLDFFDNNSFQIHWKIHVWNNTPSEYTNYCRICNVTVDSDKELAKHLLDEHKIHKCTKHDNCPKLFSSKVAYYHHVHKPKSLCQFQCQICNRNFGTEENLNAHVRGHMKPKLYQCSECRKRFATLSALKVHYRMHSGERPFACQYCDKRFAYSHHRKMHERTHTGETPYKCDICLSRFRDCSTLREHIRRHLKNQNKNSEEN